MADVSDFWRSTDFQDATLLLSSDRLQLERSRAALQETWNVSLSECDGCRHSPKRRKTAADPALSPSQPSEDGDAHVNCFEAITGTEPCAASAQNQVLTIPVHRIILTSGSDYFKTAISTLIGDSACSTRTSLSRPIHPIIVVHEEDVDAAQGVLHYLYTQTVESVHSTAPRLMQLLLVS